MEQYIAVREYELNTNEKVTIYIYKPFLDKEDYCCNFRITGFSNNIESYVIGSDGIQAIFLVLMKIGTILYTSEEYKHEKLTLFESLDLDLPYPESIADIVKK